MSFASRVFRRLPQFGVGAAAASCAVFFTVPSKSESGRDSPQVKAPKEVVVLGAGVVGVTSAYFLAKAGHQVTVVDRCHDVGRGTSQVNACSLRISSFNPINTTGSLWRLSKALATGDPVFHFDWAQVLPDPAFWRWGCHFLRASISSDWHARGSALLREMSPWSVALTKQVAKDEQIDFDLREDCGVMVAHLDEDPAWAGVRDSGTAKAAVGVRMQVLQAEEALKLEPAMGPGLGQRLMGAVHFPQDAHGDCRKFTEGLARVCREKYGVKFLTESDVFSLEMDETGGRVVAVHTGRGRLPVRGDVVVCLGSQSERLTRPLGVGLPIYPMKGYSITLDVSHLQQQQQQSATEDLLLPHGLVVLEPLHTYVIRMDEHHVRFASIAEFAGWDDRRISLDCVEALRSRASEWFPQLKDVIYSEHTRVLTGGRPETPDSVPIVSATAVPNLYVNSGHGQYGWRLACGSGKVLARIVSGTVAGSEQAVVVAPNAEGEGVVATLEEIPDLPMLSLSRFDLFGS